MQPQEGDSGCSEDTPFSGCGNLLAVTLTCKGSTGSDQGFGQVGCGLCPVHPAPTEHGGPSTLDFDRQEHRGRLPASQQTVVAGTSLSLLDVLLSGPSNLCCRWWPFRIEVVQVIYCMSVCLWLSVCLSAICPPSINPLYIIYHLPVYLSIYLSVCLSINCLSIVYMLSIHPPTHHSICPTIHLSTSPFTCPSVHPLCLSTPLIIHLAIHPLPFNHPSAKPSTNMC